MSYLSVHNINCLHLLLYVLLIGFDLLQSLQIIFVRLRLYDMHPICHANALGVAGGGVENLLLLNSRIVFLDHSCGAMWCLTHYGFKLALIVSFKGDHWVWVGRRIQILLLCTKLWLLCNPIFNRLLTLGFLAFHLLSSFANCCVNIFGEVFI